MKVQQRHEKIKIVQSVAHNIDICVGFSVVRHLSYMSEFHWRTSQLSQEKAFCLINGGKRRRKEWSYSSESSDVNKGDSNPLPIFNSNTSDLGVASAANQIVGMLCLDGPTRTGQCYRAPVLLKIQEFQIHNGWLMKMQFYLFRWLKYTFTIW